MRRKLFRTGYPLGSRRHLRITKTNGALRLLACCALLLATPFGLAADEEEKPPAGSPAAAPTDEIELEGAAGTVTEALQGKSGLRIQTLCTHCNSANVQLGGLAADLVPISLDDYPVIGGLATSMIFSILPADTIVEAQVAKGPGRATAPGRAAGGTVKLEEISPQELSGIDLETEVGSYRLVGGTLRAAGEIAPWASGSIIVGHQQTTEPVDDDEDGFNDVGTIDRDFATGRLYLEAGRNHDIDLGATWIDEETLEGKGAFDGIASDYPNGDPIWVREDAILDRREYRGGWNWKLGRGRSFSLNYLDAYRRQTLVSQASTVPGSDTLRDRFQIRDTNRWAGAGFRLPVGLSWMLTTGAEFQYQRIGAESLNLETLEVWFELMELLEEQFPDGIPPEILELFPFPEADKATETLETLSGYFDADWNISPKWGLQFGVRYDDAEWSSSGERFINGETVPFEEERSDDAVMPRATLNFSPARGWSFKLVGGGTFRAPRSIFSEICCGQDYQRNINTVAETGASLGLEALYQPSPDLRVSAYVARTEFDDHILRMVAWTQAFRQTYALANVSETEADAAEVTLRWSPTHLVTFDASAGWMSHHNAGEEEVEILVSRPGSDTPEPVLVPIDRIPYQPMRSGSVGATLNFDRGILLSGQASYTGSMLIQQFGDQSDPTDQNELFDEMLSTPGFWMVNLSFEVPLGERLVLSGGIDNLTDRVQNDLDQPNTDYNWGPLAGRSWRLGVTHRIGG